MISPFTSFQARKEHVNSRVDKLWHESGMSEDFFFDVVTIDDGCAVDIEVSSGQEKIVLHLELLGFVAIPGFN